MDVRKILMFVFGLIVLVIISGCTGTLTGTVTTDTPSKASDTQSEESDSRVVMLGLNNGRYAPDPIKLQQGKEVILKNDGSLVGCALHALSPGLGIDADFVNQKEYRFTPEKTGTFDLSCSMGMFKGTIIVE